MNAFKCVVDHGSFSAAADALGIAQPSVSQHVRALESHFGEQLLRRRRGSTPTITEAGRRVYDYAVSLIARSAEVDAALSEFRASKDRILSFASHLFIADMLLPSVVAEFAEREPKVEIKADIGRSDDVIELVRSGRVDIGLILDHSGEPASHLEWERIGRQSSVFIASPKHPLAATKNIEPDRLVKFPFIMPEEGTEYGRRLTTILTRMGVRNFKTRLQTPHMRAWYHLVATSDNLCFALRKRVAREIEHGELIALDLAKKPIPLDVILIWDKNRSMGAASRRFLRHIRRLKQKEAFTS